MPDITLCPGGDCPLQNRCQRFRARAYGRQDCFGAAPWSAATESCDLFLDIERLMPTEEATRVRAYFLWERAGRPEGRASAHWYDARAELIAAVEAELRPVT